jgi:alanyl-tRNA synthetase
LQWKIGSRAWRELRAREGVLAELARELTCGVEDLPGRLRSIKASLKAQELAVAGAEARLAGLLAERLRAEAEELAPGGLRLICRFLEAERPALLPALFQALAASPRTVVCLAAASGEGGLSWLLGCSDDLDLPLGGLLPRLLPLIDGKGGGRGHRLQGTARRPEGWPAFATELAAALPHLLQAV